MYMNKELQQLLLSQQEEEYSHISIEDEFSFYREIQRGNLEVLKGSMSIETTDGMGVLSQSPLQNQKYHLIILIAMITRFCIEGGLEPEQSYTMSDMYIRKIDVCLDSKELGEIKKAAIADFTLAMHQIRNSSGLSYHVKCAADYVGSHLNQPLKAKEVADKLHLHPDYLSHLFYKEMGIRLSAYIIRKKCETASYMLLNSTVSCTEISAFLGFSSASHFAGCFKKEYGMTPSAYRRSEGFL